DLTNEGFPFMGAREVKLRGGVTARLFRISFSGEMAFEISVPARYGAAMAENLMIAGSPYGVTPYGTEALGVMRIEKGHVAGPELNGTTTANDLGLGKVERGRERTGEIIRIHDPVRNEDYEAEICSPVFYDPEGVRQRG